MTTAHRAGELVRRNLDRLVRASGLSVADVALVAWSMPERITAKLWNDRKRVRARRLERYIDGEREPDMAALDDLARALGVHVSAFFAELPAQLDGITLMR
jgi:hypothetical protein